MTDWRKDVAESLYGQRLLPLHREDSLEAAFPQKRVQRARKRLQEKIDPCI